MLLNELEIDLQIMLDALRLEFKKIYLVKEVSVQFIIEDFGVILCGIDRTEYSTINEAIIKRFGKGWRVVYITTQDLLYERKDTFIWELMRSGYMRYIRTKFPREFKELITIQNFGKKIIEQRLKIWADDPKYRFLVEENKIALTVVTSYILSVDPSFYDTMPEFVGGE